MRKNNGTSKEMYCISRIDDAVYRTYAWRVSMSRRGTCYVRNFSDGKFGGKQAALIAAKHYRDELLKQHAPITRKEFCATKRRNNKSGITGVYNYAKRFKRRDGSIGETWYWEANWPTEPGKCAHESFSVRQFGEEVARQMAIRARERGLRKVEGLYWASERGEIAEQQAMDSKALAVQSADGSSSQHEAA